VEREGDRVALVRVLGPIDVVDDAGDAHAPTSPLRRSLLAVLALEACRVVRSDRLLEVVWNGAPPASMTTALRFHISALRRDVPIVGLIEGVRGGYRLDADVDMASFDSVAAESHVGAVTEHRLQSALALWRGDAFADAGPCAALETEAQRLVEQEAALVEAYYRAVVDDHRYAEAIAELTRRCGDHPLRESMWELLIDAHYRAGHQAEALAHIARLRTNLRDDLGIGLFRSPRASRAEDPRATKRDRCRRVTTPTGPRGPPAPRQPARSHDEPGWAER
jgi:DNA-binding SARP family transcriptional activator